MYPNLKQSWLLLLIYLLLSIGVSIVLVIPAALFGLDPMSPGFDIPGTMIVFGLILLKGGQKAERPLKESYPLRRVPLFWIVPIGFLIIGLSISLSELDNLFQLLVPMPDWIRTLFTETFFSTEAPLVSAFQLGILAPFTEEMLLRGLILQGLLTHYKERDAILWSALLFAVMHLNPWQAIGAFFVGTVSGWIFVNTRSLLPCILFHSLYNLFPFVLMKSDIMIKGYTDISSGHSFQPVWFTLTGLLLTVAGLYLANRKAKTKLVVLLR